MKVNLIMILIGAVAGLIDIMLMIRMKHDRYAIFSAFLFYFMMPFVIFNMRLFNLEWWMKGPVITFCLSLPVVIMVAKSSTKNIFPILVMSVLLGGLIGVLGHFLL